jgi:mRNA-degrading endonuclease YafQ of YafQ-DinJ toxin-antitoxin module
MQIVQTGQFKKSYKKLHPNQLPETNAAIDAIIKNPKIGEQKQGDLSWLRVYKFKLLGQLTLIGYSISEEKGIQTNNAILTLVALGPHENFYRTIKNTL